MGSVSRVAKKSSHQGVAGLAALAALATGIMLVAATLSTRPVTPSALAYTLLRHVGRGPVVRMAGLATLWVLGLAGAWALAGQISRIFAVSGRILLSSARRAR